MKSKKPLLILLLIVLAAVSVTMIACNNGKKQGEETGIYYYDAQDGEYLLSLNSGDRFVLQAGDTTIAGTFKLSGGKLEFTAAGSSELANSATYENGSIKLTYGGNELTFLRRIEYTVTFSGANLAAARVVNGRKLAVPQDPLKNGSSFLGWYADNTFSKLFDFNTPITKNTTIYAKWTNTAVTGVEYTITFVAAENDKTTVKTMGGKVYEAPTPSASGKTFNGWWLSDVGDATKLTCRYDSEYVFTEDTEVYALWDSNAPLAEVTSEGVIWDTDAAVSVVVKNSKNETVAGLGGNALTGKKCDINWKSVDAGTYTVEVTANGNTATRVYNNRVLKKVSSFVFEGGNIVFTPVSNAKKYFISVECGDPLHQHTDFDLQNYNSFSCANCPMKEGGIKFTVRAEADGYLSSVSDEFTINRVLAKVEGLNFNEESAILTWNRVDYATGYVLDIKCGIEDHEHIVENGNKTYVDLKGCTGNITVKVSAKAKGYLASENAEITVNKTTFPAPTNVNVKGSVVYWDEVKDASAYSLRINATTPTGELRNFNNVNVASPEHQYDLSQLSGYSAIPDGTLFQINVKAASASVESVWSDFQTVRKVTFGSDIKYENGRLTWENCSTATKYQVYLNDEVYMYRDSDGLYDDDFVGVNSTEIVFDKAGENTLFVRCYYADNITSDTKTITVYTHTITFVHDITLLGGSTTLYKAVDDRIEIPEPDARKGYEFIGWYNTLNGAKANGAKFTDAYFTEANDIVLYADFEPVEEGEEGEEGGGTTGGETGGETGGSEQGGTGEQTEGGNEGGATGGDETEGE